MKIAGSHATTKYRTPGCEDTDEEEDEDRHGPKLTVNNINLTINVSAENSNPSSGGVQHFVVTEKNSEKLLNIIILQNME